MASNKRGIPEIRDRLYELADELDNDELRELADQTYRRSPRRRAKNKSDKLTPARAAQIRQYARDNPDAHQREIGAEFNMNPGRVSEALDNQV